METPELMKVGIGTKETQTLKPAKVKIVAVEFQTKTKEGEDMKTPLAHFKCKHPDKEELISLSKVKLNRNDKLMVVGLWVQLDEDGKLAKSSAISEVLRTLNCSTLEEVYNKEIDTVAESDKSSFLCLKAY